MRGRRLQAESERSESAVHPVSAGQWAGQAGRAHRLSIPPICLPAEKKITKLTAFHSTNAALSTLKHNEKMAKFFKDISIAVQRGLIS